jgi:hypothetical protein
VRVQTNDKICGKYGFRVTLNFHGGESSILMHRNTFLPCCETLKLGPSCFLGAVPILAGLALRPARDGMCYEILNCRPAQFKLPLKIEPRDRKVNPIVWDQSER